MSGGGGASGAAKQARDDEIAREGRISMGTDKIRTMFRRKFNDPYYARLQAAGEKQYEPEIQTQYENSLNDLRAALIRTGNTGLTADGTYGSTAGKQLEGRLADKRARATLDVTNNVQGVINQRRQNIANAELQAIGQLQSSADANAAAQQAQNMINLNTQKEAWSPLGQVFTDVTGGLATQAELERDNRARYNLGVSNWIGGNKRYTTNVGGR